MALIVVGVYERPLSHPANQRNASLPPHEKQHLRGPVGVTVGNHGNISQHMTTYHRNDPDKIGHYVHTSAGPAMIQDKIKLKGVFKSGLQ
ncbi:hypothetical protein DPMN_173915 [Dreissena polymorpha]|uniref:Uncharacterized protein n=1 Tax=Dreissena polymorpha TaxID=45954 RepID=A0A9D4E5H0_DREPO|nr:hypothetical protein DPMN_173915 [Dreissena polymorpha]